MLSKSSKVILRGCTSVLGVILQKEIKKKDLPKKKKEMGEKVDFLQG